MSDEKPIWERVTEDGNFHDPEPENTPQYTEVEQKAMEKGWRPQTEWQGPAEEWRTAKEYLDRGSFYEKINNQRKEIQELRSGITEAQEHLRKLRESNERQRLESLEYQKRQALEEQDLYQAMEVDKQITQVQTEIENITKPKPQEPQYDPDADAIFEEWKEDNPWFGKDTELTALANALGYNYRQSNQGATPREVFDYVSRQVKAVHPQKFSTRAPAQSRSPGSVTNHEGSSRGPKFTFRDLNEDQTRVGRRFVKLGLYKDLQGYVDDLVATGEIG